MTPHTILHESGGNLSRAISYDVLLTPPVLLKSIVKTGVWDILSKTVVIPTVKTEVLEFKYKGHTFPIPGRVNYDRNISVSFLLDENQDIYKDLYTWISGVNGTHLDLHEGNIILEGHENTGFLKIVAKDWNGIEAKNYFFEGVYPSSITGAEYASDGVGTIQEVTVEFSFSYMYVLNGDEGTLGLESVVDSITGAVDDAREKLISNTIGDKITTVAKEARDDIKKEKNILFRNIQP